MQKRAVVLMSGGLDSTTVAAIAIKKGFVLHALSFDYGQRHKIELKKLQKVIKQFAKIAEHKVVKINLKEFGGSALTSNIPVPKDSFKNHANTIPITYVPARNTIFLSIALGYAETIDAFDIFIGANAIDYSNYPDCRPNYLRAFEKMANLATKKGVLGSKFKIHAPLLSLTKQQIITTGLKLGVNYADTISCYDPSSKGMPCGRCDSCTIRTVAFKQLNIQDPGFYL